MYTYPALINALSAHIIHINLNTVLYTHVDHSPTKTVYIKYYTEKQTYAHTHTHTHTHMHAHTHARTHERTHARAHCQSNQLI